MNVLKMINPFGSRFIRPAFRWMTTKRVKSVRDIKHNIVPLEAKKAIGYSTAEYYDSKQLYKLLKEKYSLLPYMADGVYHLQVNNESEAFVFSNGTLVVWGASESETNELLDRVKTVEINSYPKEYEVFNYDVDPENHGRMENDLLVLGNDFPIGKQMFAYSAGISRSVKLASLEVMLEDHLSKNKHIPAILLSGKKLPVNRAKMLKNLGELFHLRSLVNLNSDLLDLPDFCWGSTNMENCFESISRNLDVRPRIAIMNKKLDYANEIAEVIRNHLHEQHSLKLEWAIIILISVEIAFSTLHYLETGSFI
ncbi:hypothetical protein HDV04_000431 [Boothiomyces sp. JEL0838]|nr:hypothetical protein HDV04_000431 [Boothiomyces sp. JEL0838]